MQVSGIGGGAMAMGAGAIGGGTAPTAPSGVSASMSPGNPAGSAQLQSLVDMMGSFNTAEILIALMLASAMSRDDDDSNSSAMGFLAGLAMAGQLGQNLTISIDLTGVSGATSGGMDAGVGQGFDVQA